MRNPETGSLVVKSVLFQGIVPIIFLIFIITGICFGKTTGAIKNSSDIPVMMTKTMKNMAPLIVSTFIISQFIAIFNWTNLGVLLAAGGAQLLDKTGFAGLPLFICFILLTCFINLFVTSGSAKWSILAPIFVPMLGILK